MRGDVMILLSQKSDRPIVLCFLEWAIKVFLGFNTALEYPINCTGGNTITGQIISADLISAQCNFPPRLAKMVFWCFYWQFKISPFISKLFENFSSKTSF